MRLDSTTENNFDRALRGANKATLYEGLRSRVNNLPETASKITKSKYFILHFIQWYLKDCIF